MQFPAAAGVACQEVRNSSFELSATGHMPGQSLPRQPRRSRWLQCMIVFSIRRRTGLKPMVAKQRISSQSKLCRELPGTIWSGLSQGDAPKVPEKPQPHPTVTSAAELNRTASRALTSWCQGWLRLRKMRRALPGRITHPIALWRREKAVMLMPECLEWLSHPACSVRECLTPHAMTHHGFRPWRGALLYRYMWM